MDRFAHKLALSCIPVRLKGEPVCRLNSHRSCNHTMFRQVLTLFRTEVSKIGYPIWDSEAKKKNTLSSGMFLYRPNKGYPKVHHMIDVIYRYMYIAHHTICHRGKYMFMGVYRYAIYLFQCSTWYLIQWVQEMREILSWTREEIFHIFKQPCIILFNIYSQTSLIWTPKG